MLGKILTEATPVQVREALAERASRLQEQQQLPVFKIATLEGSPVDYQTRLRSPTAERKAPVVRFETSQVGGLSQSCILCTIFVDACLCTIRSHPILTYAAAAMPYLPILQSP